MEAAARVRAARWTDKDHVAALIADALHPDPLAAWLIPEPPHRRRVLTQVAAIWVEHAMFYGDIHLTHDLNAATVGFHRYRPIPPPANYHHRLTDAAGEHTQRFEALDRLLTARRPTEPHYHLAFLAVAPTAQRRGLGTAMLAHHRARLDRIDLPSWTDTAAAHTLYTRHGYTIRPVVTLPDGPTLQHMVQTRAQVRGIGGPTFPTGSGRQDLGDPRQGRQDLYRVDDEQQALARPRRGRSEALGYERRQV